MGAYIRISRRGRGSGFNRRGRGEQSRGRRENAPLFCVPLRKPRLPTTQNHFIKTWKPWWSVRTGFVRITIRSHYFLA